MIFDAMKMDDEIVSYLEMAQKLLDQCKGIRKLLRRADDQQDEPVLGGRLSGHRLVIGYQLSQVGDGWKVAQQEGQFGYDQGTTTVTATRQVHAAIHHQRIQTLDGQRCRHLSCRRRRRRNIHR